MRTQGQRAMIVVALAMLAACRSERPVAPPPAVPPANAAQLLAALRQGGLVLMRHAASEPGQDDAARVVLEDCATQRLLSAAGRAEAEAIAAAVRRLRIPIATVRSSPYCRCADTARLAFGFVLLDDDLLPAQGPRAESHLAAARRQLGTPPIPGHHTVLVTHADTIRALVGLELDEGEALIVRPAPKGGSFTPVGRIRAEQWSALAG
ncbi:MAG: histidine phosphatase family protein [Candidatus Binatia bacterium]